MQVPQYSDFNISFNGIVYNTNDIVDLSALTDIIFSISKLGSLAIPLVVLKNSINPERFTIDNVNKQVIVSVDASSDISNQYGTYFVNLWLLNGTNYLTHLTQSFVVEPSVNYSIS